MANILGVGIATIDIINAVDHYPVEDEEIRAEGQHITRGGNTTNTLCVLSQLGHQCDWLGTMAKDRSSIIITEDLQKYNVDYSLVQWQANGNTPTSYITLNKRNGSRTIVHHRDLEELSLGQFSDVRFKHYDWLHFEGRNIEVISQIIRKVKSENPNITISLEIEKARKGIEALFQIPDLLFFSKHYLQEKGYVSPKSFAEELKTNAIAVFAWGDKGSYARDIDGTLQFEPACKIEKVVDTIGAGDTFNAGFIAANLDGKAVKECLQYANRLAALKIQQTGFSGLS